MANVPFENNHANETLLALKVTKKSSVFSFVKFGEIDVGGTVFRHACRFSKLGKIKEIFLYIVNEIFVSTY